jgi:hypothetical protein
MDWRNAEKVHSRAYICGYCGNRVGSDRGYFTNSLPPTDTSIHICPHCSQASVFLGEHQFPAVSPGGSVASLPDDLEMLYNEARKAAGAGAFTASVLACRKLLMNVAVSQGADQGLAFIAYVEYLAERGFVPPNGRGWVDHIRRKGNEATHEIALMLADDASELISFSEMLLKFIYEFPSRVPSRHGS